MAFPRGEPRLRPRRRGTGRSERERLKDAPKGGGGGRHQRDTMVEFMRTYEQLHGLRVISYCIVSNHF